MAETSQEVNTNNVDTFEFLLFLILILVLMGNRNTFSSHFDLLNKEVNNINSILEAISVTSEGLQAAITAPQKLRNNL